MLSLPSLAYGDAVSSSTLAASARLQIARAKAGRRLSDYRQAEDAPLFLTGAALDSGAYYRVAWWYAVAAQILGSDVLLKRAEDTMSSARWSDIPLISAMWTANVGTVFDTAASEISAAGLPQVGSLLRSLARPSVQKEALANQNASLNPFAARSHLEEAMSKATPIAIGGVAAFLLFAVVYKLIGRKP